MFNDSPIEYCNNEITGVYVEKETENNINNNEKSSIMNENSEVYSLNKRNKKLC